MKYVNFCTSFFLLDLLRLSIYIEVTIIIPVSIFQTTSLKFLLDNKNILDYKQFRMQLQNEGNFTEN